MKTKRTLAITLVLCMMMTCACAEGGDGFLDDIGGWFSQAWKDTSDWVSQAWTDASSWVNGAWGDASKWIEQAWNDSSTWVSDIWGDVSTWATDSYNTASGTISTWWLETFDSVTKAQKNAWEWIGAETESSQKAITDRYNEIRGAIQVSASEGEQKIQETYNELLKDLQLDEKDASKVMETISAYAKEKGISVEAAETIMMPYLIQLALDSESAGNDKIPAIAVAQYLTGVIEKLSIQNEEQAQQLINKLDEILNVK